MAEEWRVSLVIGGGGSIVKGSRYRDLLRARLGDDVAVSAGKMHLFLYAGSAKAADEAGQVARAVLEEHGQLAEARLERWDPSGGEWRDPDEPAEHEDEPEQSREESTVIAFIKGAGQALQWGSPESTLAGAGTMRERRYSPRPLAWASGRVVPETPGASRPWMTKLMARRFGSS